MARRHGNVWAEADNGICKPAGSASSSGRPRRYGHHLGKLRLGAHQAWVQDGRTRPTDDSSVLVGSRYPPLPRSQHGVAEPDKFADGAPTHAVKLALSLRAARYRGRARRVRSAGTDGHLALTIGVENDLTRSTVLWLFAAGSFLQIFALPAYAALSDRIGHRPVMIAGCIDAIIAVYPILLLIASGNVLGVLLGFVIAMPLVQAAVYGPMAAFTTEIFATGNRYTGASLGYQLSSTLGGGFAPLIAATLVAGTTAGNGLFRVALFAAAAADQRHHRLHCQGIQQAESGRYWLSTTTDSRLQMDVDSEDVTTDFPMVGAAERVSTPPFPSHGIAGHSRPRSPGIATRSATFPDRRRDFGSVRRQARLGLISCPRIRPSWCGS